MKFKLFAFSIFISILVACSGSKHLSEYELQRQFVDPEDTLTKKNYITNTMPIDSADKSKLIFDLWRIETDKYPDKITIYARVFDSLGHFITNLAEPYKKDKSYNYFAKIDEGLGKVYNKRMENIPKYSVREFGANDSIPYNIVLTVDNSGSMSGVYNTILDGAELFAEMKFKYDKLAVTSFSENYEVKVPLSSDTKTILSVLKAKRQQGLGRFSSVNEGMWNSMDIFENTDTIVPRVMAIFTDGDENYSKKEVTDIIQKARDMKVHVFCVAFGYSKDESLKEVAKYTGGKFYKAYSKEELTSIFRDIYMSLRYYYLVEYTPPKYYGTHYVYSYLSVPNRTDSLLAQGEYDVTNFWKGTGNEFVVPVTFDFNKSEIKPESFSILDGIADQMISNSRLKIEIQGHTDNVGTNEVNQVLSEQRALSVKAALVQRGIDERRLRTRGFGMTMPVASNDTEAGQAKNRRTQFVILAK